MTTTLIARSRRLQPLRSAPAPRKIALVSTYPPRRCGIGAFSKELHDSLAIAAPDLEVLVYAVDREGLRYGDNVTAVLDQDDPACYRKAAARLAAAGVEAVLIQHEFGIYGGPDGAWINRFATELSAARVPYIVTLHTVPEAPSRGQAGVLRRLCGDAAAVTVFTATARRLAAAAGIRFDHFEIVPRGAPALLRFRDRAHLSAALRPAVAELLDEMQYATLVSTFGLVSPDKGLETAIAAVTAVAREMPDLRYLIAGATHPEVVRRYGECYRRSLVEMVAELGAGNHIRFLDFFLTDSEVAALLARSSAFLTPYRSRDQVGSGALTFALAAGCPVVSTSFPYARDLLAGGAGLVADPGDTVAYTAALRRMLTEPGRLAQAADAAWKAGAELLWPIVAPRAAEVIRATAALGGRRRTAGSRSFPLSAIPYQR